VFNEWNDDWEVDVEARRGVCELQDYLRKVAAFDAWVSEHRPGELPPKDIRES
jgi:hypothetical protein